MYLIENIKEINLLTVGSCHVTQGTAEIKTCCSHEYTMFIDVDCANKKNE